MEAARFVQPYPDQMTPQQIHRGPHAVYMHEAQEYSYKWGRLLHAVLLRNEDSDAIGELDLEAYGRWLQADRSLEGLDDVPTDLRARVLNETNFHLMNANLFGMWTPLALGQWASSAERAETLNGAEFSFAFQGLRLYAMRQRSIQAAGGTHTLFEPDKQAMHDALTGVMQEYDAAIVLINFIRKHPNLTFVPAPLQFERMRPRTNVDFVVADVAASKAVGVQVKSWLQREDVDAADPDRVVFIDGDTDLGNVRLVRVNKARSTEKLTAWPGIIAAKKMDMFKAHGKQLRQFSSDPRIGPLIAENPHVLVELKMLARSLVGDIKVYHEDLAAAIGERILRKL